MQFRVTTTRLQSEGPSIVSYMTLRELVSSLRKHRSEICSTREVHVQMDYTHLAPWRTMRPEFVSITQDNDPILICIRACSAKEYREALREEAASELARWEQYGENKLRA